jgi:hypothetical protein
MQAALSALSAYPHKQCDDKKDQEHEEQYFGDLDGTRGNTAKPEYRRDYRYEEKNCSPFQHVGLLFQTLSPGND